MRISDFYNRITSLPLFQGISAQDLVRIQERSTIKFLTLDDDDKGILNSGQRCIMMTWLVEGTMIRRTCDEGGTWILEEEVHAPAIIEPEALYSLTNELTSTWINKGKSRLMCISKEDFTHTLMHIDVCRTNFLCMLSQRTQQREYSRLKRHTTNIREHIQEFLDTITHPGTGRKTLKIKMTDLAEKVRETRLNVSRELNNMQDEGIVSLSRGCIEFQ